MNKAILKTAGLKTPEDNQGNGAVQNPVMKRLGEAALFAGVITLSSIAVAALAILAPFVLTASALTALFARKQSARGWRPVAA